MSNSFLQGNQWKIVQEWQSWSSQVDERRPQGLWRGEGIFALTFHQFKREKQYHAGFRHQVLSWPTNPIAHYVSLFASYPPKTVIADLGCGDAALAAGLLPKGISVISFDLVSDGKFVVEADICEKVPLPGSEDSGTENSSGEGQVIDVVVCALSLMGLNWVNCIREAWRILKPGWVNILALYFEWPTEMNAVGSSM